MGLYKMSLLNSRSINNKHGELIDFCDAYHPDALFLCETWHTPNQQFNNPSYSCYRRDRLVYDNPHNRDPTRGYGGVAVLIRNGVLGNIQLLDIPSTGFEAVAVSATVLEPSHSTQRIEKESILFVSIYRPPIHRQEQQTRFLQNLHVMLQRLLNDTSATVVIAGDFHAHCSDWCASDQDDERGKKINNTFLSYSLEQLVDFPTHLNSTGYGACLDLVITNKLHRFQKLHSLDSLGDTDHVIISWELICLLPLKPSQHYTDSHCVPNSDIGTMIPGKYSTRAVSTALWADINSILSSVNWVPMLTNTTVDAATRQFIGTIHTVLANTIGPLAPPQQVRV